MMNVHFKEIINIYSKKTCFWPFNFILISFVFLHVSQPLYKKYISLYIINVFKIIAYILQVAYTSRKFVFD